MTAFDLEALETRGNPVALFDGVSFTSGAGLSILAASDHGTVVFHRGRADDFWTFAWLDATGSLETIGLVPGPYFEPRLSPDATRFAFADGSA